MSLIKKTILIIILFYLGLGVFVVAVESKPVLSDEAIGVRPRGMLVKKRAYPATIDFSDYAQSDWEVIGANGGQARVYRTREELLWGEAVTAVCYKGAGEESEVLIKAKNPVVIPECDSVQVWLKGEIVGWAPANEDNPRIRPFVMIIDGVGKEHRIDLNPVNFPWWYVMYEKIDTTSLPKPLKCSGIGVSGCINKNEKRIYLDSLSFFKLKESPTLKLPTEFDDSFITTDQTILPQTPKAGFKNSVQKQNGKYVFAYEGDDESFRWKVNPEKGPLCGIETYFSGSDKVTPCYGSQFYVPGKTPLEIISEKLVDGTLFVKYGVDGKAVNLECRYRLTGKSLIVDIEGDNCISRIHPGYIKGADAKAFYVPYLTVSPISTGPKIAVASDMFFSVLPCWYTSNSSAMLQNPEKSVDQNLVLIGDTVYNPVAGGVRNSVKERFVLTASKCFEEVFPSIPHRPSQKREQLVDLVNLYEAYNPIQNWQDTLKSFEHIRRQGVSKLFVYHHSQTWADDDQGPQEWTMTQNCAPAVGNANMNDYLNQLREMGYLPCFYTNYCDMQPVSVEFDYDKIVRTQSGDISTHTWPGSYPVKPLLAVEIENKYAPEIRKNFNVRASFLDVHTAITPWDRVDYDPRVPSAAAYKLGYLASCNTILNDKHHYDGPVVGEGATRLFFAGLTDGDNAELAECFNKPYERPWLVDFDLKCLHDLHFGIGMSSMPRFLSTDELQDENNPYGIGINHYLAATIAFGHAGMLPLGVPQPSEYHSLVRMYYLTQQLQQRYLLSSVYGVKYFDGNKLTTTEQAILNDNVKRNQIYVEYADGLVVAVNGNESEKWKVLVKGQEYVLPPYGWVALDKDFTEYSAAIGGSRADFVQSEEYVFFDSWGEQKDFGLVVSDGAGAIFDESGDTRIVVLGPYTTINVSYDFLQKKQGDKFKVFMETKAGDKVKITPEFENGMVVLPNNKDAFAFIFAAD